MVIQTRNRNDNQDLPLGVDWQRVFFHVVGRGFSRQIARGGAANVDEVTRQRQRQFDLRFLAFLLRFRGLLVPITGEMGACQVLHPRRDSKTSHQIGRSALGFSRVVGDSVTRNVRNSIERVDDAGDHIVGYVGLFLEIRSPFFCGLYRYLSTRRHNCGAGDGASMDMGSAFRPVRALG